VENKDMPAYPVPTYCPEYQGFTKREEMARTIALGLAQNEYVLKAIALAAGNDRARDRYFAIKVVELADAVLKHLEAEPNVKA
jgi:hypothetical protein